MVFCVFLYSMSIAAPWLWIAMLMTSLAMTSSGRDVTNGRVEELRIAVIVPYDEQRLFSRYKVLPAVRDALQRAHNITDKLVPGLRFVVFEADSGCSSATAPIAAIDLHYQQKVSACLSLE